MFKEKLKAEPRICTWRSSVEDGRRYSVEEFLSYLESHCLLRYLTLPRCHGCSVDRYNLRMIQKKKRENFREHEQDTDLTTLQPAAFKISLCAGHSHTDMTHPLACTCWNSGLPEAKTCLAISSLLLWLILARRAEITCRLVFPSAHELQKKSVSTHQENVPRRTPDRRGLSFPPCPGLFIFPPLATLSPLSLSLSSGPFQLALNVSLLPLVLSTQQPDPYKPCGGTLLWLVE